MEIDCIVKVFDPDNDKLEISIKETEVNPFFGAEQRHPVGSRRLAVISGKPARWCGLYVQLLLSA